MLKIGRVVLSLFVVSSIALANPTKDMDSLNISKNDKEFLFGTNNANIVALNDVEMKDTEGKFLGTLAKAVGVGALRAVQLRGSQDKNPNKNIPPRKIYLQEKNTEHTKDDRV